MSEQSVEQIRARMRQEPAFRNALLADPVHALQGYALTEEEECLFLLPNFRWAIEQRLAGVSYPRSEQALGVLQRLGVRALLCLATTSVSEALLNTYQLQGAHLPVADFTAPTLAQVEQAIGLIEDFLRREMPVAVHCGAGLGRTGTILACYLVACGSSAGAAILQVRSDCPGSIETSEQEAAIVAYAQLRQDQSGV